MNLPDLPPSVLFNIKKMVSPFGWMEHVGKMTCYSLTIRYTHLQLGNLISFSFLKMKFHYQNL